MMDIRRVADWLYNDTYDDVIDDKTMMMSLADAYSYNPHHYSEYTAPVHWQNGRRELPPSGRKMATMTSQHRWKSASSNALSSFFSSGGDTIIDEPNNNWMKLHPSHWTKGDVFDLIFYVAEMSTAIDLTRLRGEKFKDIDGRRLPRMTREEFLDRDPQYGDLLYDTIDDLLNKSKFIAPEDFESYLDHLDHLDHHVHHDHFLSRRRSLSPEVAPPCDSDENHANYRRLPKPVEDLMCDEEPNLPIMCDANENQQRLNLATIRRYDNDVFLRPLSQPAAIVSMCGHTYEIDSAADFGSVLQPAAETRIRDRLPPRVPRNDPSNPVYIDLSTSRPPVTFTSHHSPIDLRTGRSSSTTAATVSPCSRSYEDDWLMPLMLTDCTSPAIASNVKRKSHGGVANKTTMKKSRRSSRDETSDNNDAIGVTSGGRHLWEFIRDLLRAGERNNGGPGTVIVPGGTEGATPVAIDSIIRWENREDGVFRIIDSKIVAKLWGCRKHNSTMTYEKLSRALRWCRKNKFFASLPKDAGYPKKLCFKFGPLAVNWRDS